MFVENVVVDYRDRPDGSESKLNTFTDEIKVIKTILRLFKTYKPFAFFSIIALFLAVLAISFFIPVLITYIESGTVPNFPTLMVCCFVMTVSILSFFSGTILQTLRQKEKQDFEMRLQQAHNEKIK